MFLHTIRSEGLAHLSYLVGDKERAAVIDPRQDCDIYLDMAYREGAQITHIFETHRNEDYVIGSKTLAARTGAAIYHGKQLPFEYGNPVEEGDTFELGALRLSVLETPGHTDESLSLVLADQEFSQEPVAVFTGDALFIGDVGRTDFFPDRAEEVAGLLYDSIFHKLLPLGDEVLLYPAHGAGSVCGGGMASREFSTLGYERKHNPVLQLCDRAAFIEHKISEHHNKPPYFKQVEAFNQYGPPSLERLPQPKPYDVEAFAEVMEQGMIVVDTRSPEAIAGACITGSLALPLDMIPAYGGWFLPYDKDLALVVQRYEDVDTAVRYLIRLGYDRVAGYLSGGMTAWEKSGRQYGTIPALHAQALKKRIEANEAFTLLDVRSEAEFNQSHLPNATHLYLGTLPEHLEQIPADRPVTTFCGSGKRAVIAASLLKMNGFTQVEDCLGSLAACSAIGCPVITPET